MGMNKFDDMMLLLHRKAPLFRQLVAVDCDFELFQRAWCIAEIVQAHGLSLPHTLQIHSVCVKDRHYRRLAALDVRACDASRPEDKALILSGIDDIDLFNETLHDLIFGQDGLLASWMDGRLRALGIS